MDRGSDQRDVQRGRFAPTPSGQLHLGNAWVALLSWLQIRQAGGQFVLRMEDVDRHRSRPEFAEQILADLRWLGLDWDEGPDVGGPHGSYTQSERDLLYAEALGHLERQSRLYPCYCSRAEVKAAGPTYGGACRQLSAEERKRKAEEKTPALRFAAGAEDEEDFVVKRADGMFSYQLAVVVDDAAMGITDVLRGGDLLDATPQQLRLYETFGAAAPRFHHTPLLLDTDGRKLSKSANSLTLAALRDRGMQPEQVIGYLASISRFHDRPEPMQAEELIPAFDLEKLPAEPVTLDEQKLKPVK